MACSSSLGMFTGVGDSTAKGGVVLDTSYQSLLGEIAGADVVTGSQRAPCWGHPGGIVGSGVGIGQVGPMLCCPRAPMVAEMEQVWNGDILGHAATQLPWQGGWIGYGRGGP